MIYVECKPDEALLMCMSIPRRQIVHENKGKFEVCKRLQEQSDCRGLIDEDPGSHQPRYISGLSLTKDEHNLKVFHDRNNNNYLIVLRPRLEEWVIEASQKAGISLRQYGLPSDGLELHHVINVRLDNFQRLLTDLNNAGTLKVLRRLLVGSHERRSRRTEKGKGQPRD